MPKDDVNVDHYAALNILQNASADEVKKQFRRLALVYHPDRNIGREAEFHSKFQAIQAAHEVLIDPIRRKVYDRSRLIQTSKLANQQKNSTYAASTSTRTHPTSTKNNATSSNAPKSSDGPFSTKNQWNSRSYGFSSQQSAFHRAKAANGSQDADKTYDRYKREEVPRTPKKTRDKPYAPASSSQPTTPMTEDMKKETRNSFFADRNPREKEWMAKDAGSTPGKPGNRSKSTEHMHDAWAMPGKGHARTSTTYSYTPRERTRTNPFDAFPPRTSSDDYGTGASPTKTKTNPKSHVSHDSTSSNDPPSHSARPRRTSSSSANGDGNAQERRRFSYLFTDDGTRKPHRASRQPEVEDDTDEEDSNTLGGKNVFANMGRPSNTTHQPGQTFSNSIHQEFMPSTKSPNTEWNQWAGFDTRKPFGTSRSANASPLMSPTYKTRHRSGSPTKTKKQDQAATGKDKVKFKLGQSNRTKTFPILSPFPKAQDNDMPLPTEFKQPQTTFSFEFGKSVPDASQTNFNINSAFSPSNWDNTTNPFAPLPTPRYKKPPVRVTLNTNFFETDTAKATCSPENSSSQHVDTTLPETTESNTDTDNNDNTFPASNLSSSLPGNFVADDWKTVNDWKAAFDVNLKPPIASRPGVRSRNSKGINAKKIPLTAQMKSLDIRNDAAKTNQDGAGDAAKQTSQSNYESAFKASKHDEDTQNSPFTAPSPMAMDLDSPVPTPQPDISIPNQNRGTQFLSPEQGQSYDWNRPVSPLPESTSSELPSKTHNLTKLPIPKAAKKPSSPKKQKVDTEESGINLDDLNSIPPLFNPPQTNGIGGQWTEFSESLPFPSKPAPFVDLSPPASPSRRNVSLYISPMPPRPPVDVDRVSYNKYCAQLTIYQTQWNDYSVKLTEHFRTRLEGNIDKFAHNIGFANGVHLYDPVQVNLNKDFRLAQQVIRECEEDDDVRANWETARSRHKEVFREWVTYLEKCKALDGF